jgi:glycosyltransferase involved in cell wall biosynthesis
MGRHGDPVMATSSVSRLAPSTPLRVLHLVSRSHRRGSEMAAVELADELDHLGHRNRLMALGPALDGSQEPGLVPLGRSRREGPAELVSLAWRVRRLVAEEPTDVVLAHGSWPAAVASLAVPRRGPLLVWQRILGFPDKVWRPVRRRWWGAVARRCDASVALTVDDVAEQRRLGFRGPVWLIPNFRKPDRFRGIDREAASSRLRAQVGVAPDVPVIGFVGHLVRQKRPDRALEVLARLGSQGRRPHLVLAGTGSLRPSLESQAQQLGVADAVTFLGQRDDVEWVFAGIDVALLTSETEGIPGVAIEALMAGCPMVTVPVGGVAQVVEDGVTGLVLDGDDPALMADAVAQLLGDRNAREAMSRECRARIDRFSAAAAAAVYAERLTAALAGR